MSDDNSQSAIKYMKNEVVTVEQEARPTPLLWDIGQAAARLNISVPSCRKLIRQQRLRRIVNFRKILISESELQRFAATVQ